MTRGLKIAAAQDFHAIAGRGVRARVEGRRVDVVGPADAPGPQPAVVAAAVAEIEEAGGTAVLVLADGDCVGVLELHDRIRGEAADSVRALATLTAAAPVLITGDNRSAAARLAHTVGIDTVHAGLLPEHKVDAVTRLREQGHRVLVVGDGVNDAPAMAAAHTSVAMGRSGADLTRDTADAVTVRDDLTTVPTVVALARRARRVVTANLVVAAGIICALVVWDLVGHLPLPLGVAGHEGSTILVALNGLRLLTDRAWRRAATITR